jgi:hypothetical protein
MVMSECSTYVVSMLPVNIHGDHPKISGMDSALIREFIVSNNRGVELHLIAPSSQNETREIQGGFVHNVAHSSQAHLEKWFDYYWTILHPEAYLPPALPKKLSSQMFGVDICSSSDLTAYYEEVNYHSDSLLSESNLIKSIGEKIISILHDNQDSIVIYWLDFSYDVINTFIPQLNGTKIKHIFQSHLCLPSCLFESSRGRDILQSMSYCDEVQFHTQSDCDSFLSQVKLLGLNSPAVSLYVAGIDCEIYDKDWNLEHAHELGIMNSKFQSTVELLKDIRTSKHSVPHRFISLDRLDPGKGTHNLLLGIDIFLEGLQLPSAEIQSQYRFYLLMDYFHTAITPLVNTPNSIYVNLVRQQVASLMDKYPGVVFVGENIPNRKIIGVLLENCHYLSTSSCESLGMAPQESLYVNSEMGSSSSAVISFGSGFGTILKESVGNNSFPIFYHVGDINGLVEGIRELSSNSTSDLRRRCSRMVVESLIKPRSLTTSLFIER